ncbi:hypothetical protein ACEPPN_000897 [Leptodophora sp. 'Broadleaf-Isolate-01']
MDSSPPQWCAPCKQRRPASDFPLNHLGARYKTCVRHRSNRSLRQPLGEIDPNGPRQTRSGSVAALTDNPRPAKRRRRTRAEIEATRALTDNPPAPPPPPPPPPLPAVEEPLAPVTPLLPAVKEPLTPTTPLATSVPTNNPPLPSPAPL